MKIIVNFLIGLRMCSILCGPHSWDKDRKEYYNTLISQLAREFSSSGKKPFKNVYFLRSTKAAQEALAEVGISPNHLGNIDSTDTKVLKQREEDLKKAKSIYLMKIYTYLIFKKYERPWK